jgi:hypothetical protein
MERKVKTHVRKSKDEHGRVVYNAIYSKRFMDYHLQMKTTCLDIYSARKILKGIKQKGIKTIIEGLKTGSGDAPVEKAVASSCNPETPNTIYTEEEGGAL